MNVKPTAEQIERSHAEWLVHHNELEGINSNLDVDSILFKYLTTSETPTEFWGEVHKNATAKGWKIIEDLPQSKRYQRIIPRTGKIAFHSAEETRISIKDDKVFVAWIHADHSGDRPPKSVAQTSEGKWAEENLWPWFQEIQTEETAK